ncbi:MAG: hypothetical protein WC648_04785 [Candidatus Paceibacterota bacterium]|jgi:hypothetical protein
MTDRLEIVPHINDPNLKAETRALPALNPELDDGMKTPSKETADITLRQFRIKSLLLEGASPMDCMTKLGISESTFYRDLVAIGHDIRARDSSALLALMMNRYESKRTPILKELQMAKTPWVTARMTEILNTIDKDFWDFLFKSGMLTAAPTREIKKIIIEFGTSDAELERIANGDNTPIRKEDDKINDDIIDAEFTQSSTDANSNADVTRANEVNAQANDIHAQEKLEPSGTIHADGKVHWHTSDTEFNIKARDHEVPRADTVGAPSSESVAPDSPASQGSAGLVTTKDTISDH